MSHRHECPRADSWPSCQRSHSIRGDGLPCQQCPAFAIDIPAGQCQTPDGDRAVRKTTIVIDSHDTAALSVMRVRSRVVSRSIQYQSRLIAPWHRRSPNARSKLSQGQQQRAAVQGWGKSIVSPGVAASARRAARYRHRRSEPSSSSASVSTVSPSVARPTTQLVLVPTSKGVPLAARISDPETRQGEGVIARPAHDCR